MKDSEYDIYFLELGLDCILTYSMLPAINGFLRFFLEVKKSTSFEGFWRVALGELRNIPKFDDLMFREWVVSPSDFFIVQGYTIWSSLLNLFIIDDEDEEEKEEAQ